MTCFVCADSPVEWSAPLSGPDFAYDGRGQSAGLLAAEIVPAMRQDLDDLGEAVVGGHVAWG